MPGKQRCINLDWLEVYVLEPISRPNDELYFTAHGWRVLSRGYGTRIYNEMFTLIGADDYPFIEVRRNPKANSVLPINAVHVRLVNRACYYDNAGELLTRFLELNQYTFVSVSRVDICMDFERFDKGDDPQKFVKRYVGHKYAKINQAQAMAHWDDQWERRDFNSLSWGSKNSDVNTKMYNKTLELYDEKIGAFKKPYILQSWLESGLIDDPIHCLKLGKDGKPYRPVIWRVEFSIKSNAKGWFVYNPDGEQKQKRSVRNTLQTYLTRDRLLPIFDLLQQHYFHFKKYKQGRRKYDCQDKVLFDFGTDEQFYSVQHPVSSKKPDALVLRLIRYMQEYIVAHPSPQLQKASEIILQRLKQEEAARFLYNEYSPDELNALRQTISLRMSGSNQDPALIAADILHLLRSNEIF